MANVSEWVALALALSALGAGCFGPEFEGTGGGQSGGEGSATSVGSGAGASGTGGGAAGGSAPCIPSAEVCNGADDDCDGLADEPDTVPAEACGCDWTTIEGRYFALCPNAGSLEGSCPGGLSPVAFRDASERFEVEQWLSTADLALPLGVLTGLRQAATAGDPNGSWSWGGSEGIVPPWSQGEPNDGKRNGRPADFENGEEDCGGYYINEFGLTFVDLPCEPVQGWLVACEEDDPYCIDGTPCLLAEGCVGELDCTLPPGERCAPPVTPPDDDNCNGLDDDCDGFVDGTGARGVGCDCDWIGQYGLCKGPGSATYCGPGARLVVPRDLATYSDLESILQGALGDYRVGGYQLDGPIQQPPGASWYWADDDSSTTPWWGPNEPNDASTAQQCLAIDANGFTDVACSSDRYICRAL